ncbi:Phloem protein 2-like [Dillenia turbinata]|uniref:Phloem protein 2-like n=1 Tax=Dillenia turbinata TaxID=194707 RepID=A0AAN8VEB4_9MAGN
MNAPTKFRDTCRFKPKSGGGTISKIPPKLITIDIFLSNVWNRSIAGISSAAEPNGLVDLKNDVCRLGNAVYECQLIKAELIQVCWLEVVGCVENARPGTKYQVGFRVALKPNATGWDECTAIMVAKLGKSGKMIPIGIDLSQYYGKGLVDIPAKPLVVEVPQQASPSGRKISFGLYEIKQGNWKRGLEVHYAFVREIGSV